MPVLNKEVKVGLALGGGVARGMAHIGVLQVLHEHNIPVHVVAGTSAGALVGAMYSAGLDPWEMQGAAESLNWRGMVRLKLRRDGLLDSGGLERFILSHVGDLQFQDLKIPFTAVATDLLSGEEILLNEGRVATAVRASCAFPGIFLPVRLNNRTLVDGGLVNNVPTSVARQMGADVVIAVELNRPRAEIRPPRNLLHIMLYSLAVLQRPQIAACLSRADICVQPDLNDFSVVELERLHELIEVGREAALQALPQLHAVLERAAEGNLDLQAAELTAT